MAKPNIKLVKADVLARLRELQKNGDDIEANHCLADDILCEFISALGHEDVAEEFDALHKWYA